MNKNEFITFETNSPYYDYSGSLARYNRSDFSMIDDMIKTVRSMTVKNTNKNTLPKIKNVVFNDPLTIIIWEDGTKTYVKASGEDTFDPEKGMALAIAKKAMGNTYGYFETIQTWIEKDQKRKKKRSKKKEPEVIGKVVEKKVTEEGVTAKVVIDGNLEVLKALGIVEPVEFEEEYFE